MKIKSKYYRNKVFQKLKEDIESALREFPDFREELFEKLYTFFEKYFSESGSIYFVQTRYPQSVYERVYKDDKDVILFWKTHMLYYVKSDRLFNDLDVEIEGYKFHFSILEHKKANEKRKITYEFKGKREDGTLVFNVLYSEGRKETDIEEILKELKKQGVNITEDILERAFRVFERQSEVDFFINKNAKEFLKEQFDLWMYHYIFRTESEWTEKRIKQLQVLKDIAYKIIDFIGQFEDELVKIWNKPKFVLNSNYVITLDRIAKKKGGIEVIEKIINHENFKEQVKEWKELEIVDDSFNKNEIILRDLTGKNLNPKYQFLPIDTKYFKDLELEIISLFDDLDNELDGWLIKSENYQALNTILPKFRGEVQTIYIDPPFNTGRDFLYMDRFQDSTWLTMMENRLRLGKDFLSSNGSIFVHLDSNADYLGKILLDEIFGQDCFRVKITWKRHTGPKIQSLHFPNVSDFILVYSKNAEKWIYNPQYKEYSEEYIKKFYKYEDEKGKYSLHNFYAPGSGPPRIFFGKEIPPPEGHHWAYTQEKIDNLIKEGRIILDNKGFPKLKIYLNEMKGIQYDNIITDIYVIQGSSNEFWNFPTQKPEKLLSLFILASSGENDLIMDFFLGSGTTTAVAHKLKRKWIGIEMGEHFYTVVLPRMKKVLAYDKSGISKEKDVKEKYNEKNAGGFFKYYELEQYEDTLKRVKYEDTDLFDNPYKDPYNQYIFMKDEKLLSALEIDYENDRVKVDLSKLYDNIDVAETLSNLTGKWIKKITADKVIFEDGEEIDLNNLDYKLIKPLIWW